MDKFVLKQKVGATKRYLVDGEGFSIGQSEILEIDETMTIRELMEKVVRLHGSYDTGKRNKSNFTVYGTKRNTEIGVELKWIQPVNEEWEKEETEDEDMPF